MSKFYALGVGVDPVEHATVEVLQALGSCDRVFADGLDRAALSFLAGFCRKGRPVALAAGAPSAGAAARLTRELATGRTTALVTPGHPFYWNGVAGEVVGFCRKRSIPWETFGSVSPMGLAIAQAGVTLGTDVFGLQSYDCAAIASRSARLNDEWPLVVYFYSPLGKEALGAAARALSERYAPEHSAIWCLPEGPRRETVACLARSLPRAARTSVLYLPPAKKPGSALESGSWEPTPKEVRAPEWVKE